MFSISTWDRKNRSLVIPSLFLPSLAVMSHRSEAVPARPRLGRTGKQEGEGQYMGAPMWRVDS